jgi:predicted transcriptional regulator
MYPFMDTTLMDILQEVIDALHACRGSWQSVADATGVPYSTITKIAQGVTLDPRINTVQQLHDFFCKNGQ